MTDKKMPPKSDYIPHVIMSAQLVGLECLHHSNGMPEIAFHKFHAHSAEIILAELYKRMAYRSLSGRKEIIVKSDLDELTQSFEMAVYCKAEGKPLNA
jgi:hypothetical protein